MSVMRLRRRGSRRHSLCALLAATDTDLSRSPPGAYDQNWPVKNSEEFSASDKPPVLPPHLLNIILNKDTAAHVRHPPPAQFDP